MCGVVMHVCKGGGMCVRVVGCVGWWDVWGGDACIRVV